MPTATTSLYAVAIVGRPNAGKSSLFNALTRKDFAIVSEEAGVTRDTLRQILTLHVDPTGKSPLRKHARYSAPRVLLYDTAGISHDMQHEVEAPTRKGGKQANDLAAPPSNKTKSAASPQFTQKNLDSQISQQILQTAKHADILMAVFDLQDIIDEDRRLLIFLRKLNKPLLTVFNKADNEKDRHLLQSQAYSLGLGAQEPLYVSARTGNQLHTIHQALITARHALIQTKTPPATPESISRTLFANHARPWEHTIAIIGKPNAGKSSLLNALIRLIEDPSQEGDPRENSTGSPEKLGEKTNFAETTSVVHHVPGTTRDSVEKILPIYKMKKNQELDEIGKPIKDDEPSGNGMIRFLDTAGLRRRSRQKENLEVFSVQKAIHALRQSDMALLIIDATEPLSEQDKKIAATAAHARKPLIVCMNKWDLWQEMQDSQNPTDDPLPASDAQREQRYPRQKGRPRSAQGIDKKLWEDTLSRMHFLFPLLTHFPTERISAASGFRLENLVTLIKTLLKSNSEKLSTPRVNTLIKEAMKAHPPPTPSSGSPLKVYYGLQTKVATPQIKLFINQAKLLTPAYTRYLTLFIQEKAFAKGIPLQIVTEERSRD